MKCGIDRHEPAWLWSTSCSASFEASAKYLLPSGADRITKSSESGYRKKWRWWWWWWWWWWWPWRWWRWDMEGTTICHGVWIWAKIIAEYQCSSAAFVLFVSALNNPDTPRILETHRSRICFALNQNLMTAFQVYSARLEGNMLKRLMAYWISLRRWNGVTHSQSNLLKSGLWFDQLSLFKTPCHRTTIVQRNSCWP